MQSPAHPKYILITDTATFLACEIAKYYLSQNALVYGLSKNHLPHELLKNHNFTLLDVDVNQPLPSSLPKFDLVLNFLNHNSLTAKVSLKPSFSASTENIRQNSPEAQIFLLASIWEGQNYYDYFETETGNDNNLHAILYGDVYGPAMNLEEQNLLANLINQAVTTDKIILENEGNDPIYPAYITDAVAQLVNLAHSPGGKISYIVSQNPRTSLSVAYEIQNAAGLYLNKVIGLFFKGYPKQHEDNSHLKIEAHLNPHTEFDQGLKNTFHFLAQHQSHQVQPSPTRYFQPATPKEEKKLGILSRASIKRPKSIPIFSKKPKLIIFLAVALVVFFISKLGLDVYLGIKDIKTARVALLSGNFDQAAKSADSATLAFQRTAGKIKVLTFPFSFISSSKIKSLTYSFDAATQASVALSETAQASKYLAQDIKNVLGDNSAKIDLETPSALLQKATLSSNQAYLFAQSAQKASLFKTKVENLKSQSQNLAFAASSAYDLLNLLKNITGKDEPKTYLLLLQNNAELRPGGGFIGSIGEIQFDAGQLKNIAVQDVYALDGQLKEKIDPPKELKDKLGVDQFFLRDSNWTPDFTLNAGIARDFYKKETGKNVDGVIAFDVDFMKKILDLTGPIHLSDYNEDISSQNLLERGQFHSEIGFFPGSTQKKDFFGTLANSLFHKMVENLTSSQNKKGFSYLTFLQTVNTALNEKHLMVSFDDNDLANYIKSKNWSGTMPPQNFNSQDDSYETRDFIALSEANLGANKVNRLIERKVSYDMTIGRDADLVGKLTISYNNTSKAETWPAGKYVNFLRVYVPTGASLFAYQNGSGTDVKDVTVKSQNLLTEFSTFVEVPIKSQRSVTFTYRLPKNIQLEKAPVYHLYVEKQPGTGSDPFSFTFNLPDYLGVKSVNGKSQDNASNISLSGSLAKDLQYTLDLDKK